MIKNIISNKKIIIAFISIITLLSITLITCLLIFYSKKDVYIYKNNYYSLSYDSTWKKKVTGESAISFIHSTGSTIDISIRTLDSNHNNDDLSTLLVNVESYFENQNKNYHLITKKIMKVTSNNYDGYQLLYEDNDNQVMLIVGKKADKLFAITYVADNKYFDILLDSVNNIINNFKILDESIALNTKAEPIKINTINYVNKTNGENINCDYKNTQEYEMFNNHYNVKYQIPTCFEMDSFDSKYGSYTLFSLDKTKTININTNVINQNIYDYLTDDTYSIDLAYNIKTLKANKDYKNVNVENEKLSYDKEAYIYKITYDYISSMGDNYNKKYEKYYLIYYIDYLRTFVITIESTDAVIGKDLLSSVRIKDVIKYGDNIQRKIDNGNLVDDLKIFTTNYGNREEYYDVSYKIPYKYVELDQSTNKYQYRFFGLDYDTTKEDYNYKIDITLSNIYTIASYMKKVKEQYSNSQYINSSINYVKQITRDNIKFNIYSGKYTIKDSKIVYREVYLLTELNAAGGLYIAKIYTKQNSIPDSLINDFSSININKIKYSK